jgi:hypothetical protein
MNEFLSLSMSLYCHDFSSAWHTTSVPVAGATPCLVMSLAVRKLSMESL